MDAILLARIQFAFAAGFHYIFPPTTLGLSLVIVFLEGLYYKTGKENYKTISTVLIKLLGLVFVCGVATGITLEFAFGTNWSEYSRMVGDIFGAPLAAEGVFAFFMESIFLGVLLFGRDRVSKKAYLVAAIMVCFGSHLSGLWIIIANSFMQTPAGYKIVEGRAVLTDFFEAAVNHSTIPRYIHVIIGGWITGSLVAAAIGGWYILKKRVLDSAKLLVKVALPVFIISCFIQLGAGHFHAVQVALTQPAKMAAFEGVWETGTGVDYTVLGMPDEEKEETAVWFSLPKMLSYMIHFDTEGKVIGLKDFPKDERPPVVLSFISYHIMIFAGVLMMGIGLLSLYMMKGERFAQTPWFLKLLLWSIPLPYIANEIGWMAAEVGRQPWVVYNIMKTSAAVSPTVPAWQILATLIMFVIVYTLIFVIFLKIFKMIVKKGPESLSSGNY